MKIKKGFALTEFADGFVAVPKQGADISSNSVISLNKTAAFIWRCLETDRTFDEVADEMVKTFDVDRKKPKLTLKRYWKY